MCMNDCNKYYVLAFDICDIRVQTFVVYEQYQWVNRASETLKQGYFVTIILRLFAMTVVIRDLRIQK